MVEMRIYGLTLDAQSKSPVVILRDMDNDVMLPIWVGPMEAMAISLVLNKEHLPRPLTHDLFLLTLRGLKAKLRRVEIIDYKDGVYYAALVIYGQDGRIRVDCRPSDAIAWPCAWAPPSWLPSLCCSLPHKPKNKENRYRNGTISRHSPTPPPT